MAEPWFYVTDSKFSGIGIDLVTEQQLRAFSEAGRAVDLVARGRLDLPGIRNFRQALPPTKLLSWLPSQDYYALNKRWFSRLGRRHFERAPHAGVVAWSKTALHPFEAAARAGVPRILNVGSVSNSWAPDLRACWTLLEADSNGHRAEQRRVAYDLAAALDAVHRAGHPTPEFMASHLRGERTPPWLRA